MGKRSSYIFGWLQAAFIIIGSVVGAGFISGGELVRFFPTSNYLPYVYAAGVLFFAYFALLLACGKKYGGFDGVLSALFQKFAPAVHAVFGLCCFVICATMLAGIDSVFFEAFGIPKSVPVLSAAVLAAVFFICRKGIGGIGKVNFVLVPVILVFVVAFAFTEKGGEYDFTMADNSRGLLYTLLYVGMNAFLAAPVVCDLGKSAPPLPVSLTASFCIAFCAALILGVICREGANALGADMPLLYVVGKRGAVLGKVFSLVSLCGHRHDAVFFLLSAARRHGASEEKRVAARISVPGRDPARARRAQRHYRNHLSRAGRVRAGIRRLSGSAAFQRPRAPRIAAQGEKERARKVRPCVPASISSRFKKRVVNEINTCA